MYKKSNLIEGARFIDLNKDYADIKLIFVGKNSKNNNTMSVIWYNFPDDPTIIELAKYTGKLFPDLNGPRTKIEDKYKEIKRIYNSSHKELRLKIYNAGHKKILVQEVLDFYKSKGVSFVNREALLKLDLAKGLLKYEKQAGGDFIKLSQNIVEIENKKRFLQSIATEITSKSDRIELLIQHGQTKGNYRELLLRSILKKYIPSKYDVATGFIEDCKRQCDIIIYDAHNFSPLFRENELVVVPKKSVRAIIEVKSTLSSNDLSDALELLHDVSKDLNYPAPVFKGIFAFKQGFSSDAGLGESIYNFYHKKDPQTKLENNLWYLYQTVNAFCVIDKQCLVTDLIDFKFKDKTIRPRLYSIHSDNLDLKLYCTAFFNELFTFLDVENHAKKDNVNYFDTLDDEIQYKLERVLYLNDWIPSSCFQNEHNFDIDSIWKRVSNVINWRAGNITIQDLEKIYFSNYYNLIDYKQKFEQP